MNQFELYLVTDPELGGGPELVPDIVAEAIKGGVTVVQLRDKDASDDAFSARARHLKVVCDALNTPLFVNDRIAVAIELGVHLHIGQGDIAYIEARRRMPDTRMVGLSIENLDQLNCVIEQCRKANVGLPDVIGIGPVTATSTKPDAAPGLGISGIANIVQLAQAHNISTVAIGGVGVDNAKLLASTEVDGICIVSAIMAAQSPREAAEELLKNFKD